MDERDLDLGNDHEEEFGLSNWIFRDREERRLRRPPSESERDVDTGRDDAFVLPNKLRCWLSPMELIISFSLF